MLSHYSTLRSQLIEDIAATLGSGCKISFGRLTKPREGNRYGFVFTDVQRQGVGRQQQETWSFTIFILVPIPPAGMDPETLLLDLAGDLTMRLAPYDLVDVPAPVGSYAGIAALRRVTRVRCNDLKDSIEDQTTHVGVMIEFSCMTIVYQ